MTGLVQKRGLMRDEDNEGNTRAQEILIEGFINKVKEQSAAGFAAGWRYWW